MCNKMDQLVISEIQTVLFCNREQLQKRGREKCHDCGSSGVSAITTLLWGGSAVLPARAATESFMIKEGAALPLPDKGPCLCHVLKTYLPHLQVHVKWVTSLHVLLHCWSLDRSMLCPLPQCMHAGRACFRLEGWTLQGSERAVRPYKEKPSLWKVLQWGCRLAGVQGQLRWAHELTPVLQSSDSLLGFHPLA